MINIKKIFSKKDTVENKAEVASGRKSKFQLKVDKDALKKLKLVVVAYSHVEREFFPTEDAYNAEIEVEERAKDVVDRLVSLGINAKAMPGDRYFLTNLLVDKPDIVLNLVDTLRGKDNLQTSVRRRWNCLICLIPGRKWRDW